jgi:tetratricopeptide (TPR) repeat protein
MRREARRSSGASIALALVVAAMLSSRPAHAEDPKAQAARSFRTGSEAYTRGDFRTAARAFDEAYRVFPRGAAAYNAGLAWESAGERSRAADNYTSALEASDLGSAERADATGRLRALEQAIGRLAITSPSATRLLLDEVELHGSSVSVHVEPGKHALRAEYPGGRTESRALVARPGVEQTVTLVNAASKDPVADPVESPPEIRPDRRDDEPPPPHHEHAASASPDRTAVWLVLGGAVAASGTAVVLFELGLTARNEFANDLTSRSLHNQAEALRAGTWIAWSVAGGLAATGVILYFTASSPAPSQGSAGASVALDARGVTLRVGF